MAITETKADGTVRILQNGRWRDVTEDEQRVLEQGNVATALEAGGESFAGLKGLLQTVSSFGGRADRFRTDESIQAGQQQAREIGLGNLAESGERLDELERLSPGAAFAGQLGFEALTEALPGGLIAQGLRRAVKGAVGEGAEELAEQAGRRALGVGDAADPTRAVTSQEVGQIGGVLSSVGDDSVGAMSQAGREGLWRQLKRAPGMRKLLEKIEESVGTTRSTMTNDQRELISGGAAERVGFEFLPGQDKGNNLIAEIIKSQPFMADAYDPILTANARNLEARTLRAVGLPEGATFGRSSLRQADEELARRFEDVSGNVKPFALPDELRAALDDPDILTKNARFLFKVNESGQPLSGNQVMELRSRMNDALGSARSDRSQGVKAQHIQEQLQELDDLIGKNIRGGKQGDAWAQWKDTQQRWRVNIAMNGRGVVQPDGSISMKTLAANLEKTFERDFRKNLTQIEDGVVKAEGMPRDVAELLDFTRVARAFESNLGDSGTASRLAIQQILSGGLKEYGKQRLAAKFITDVLLDRPADAARLPN